MEPKISATGHRLLVHLNHVASFIENADQGIVWSAEKFCVEDCIIDRIWPGAPQAGTVLIWITISAYLPNAYIKNRIAGIEPRFATL